MRTGEKPKTNNRNGLCLVHQWYLSISWSKYRQFDTQSRHVLVLRTDFLGIALNQIFYRHCSCDNVIFREIPFRASNFPRSIFINTTFIRCQMDEVNFHEVVATESKFDFSVTTSRQCRTSSNRLIKHEDDKKFEHIRGVLINRWHKRRRHSLSRNQMKLSMGYFYLIAWKFTSINMRLLTRKISERTIKCDTVPHWFF